jgi:hypothetical protein
VTVEGIGSVTNTIGAREAYPKDWARNEPSSFKYLSYRKLREARQAQKSDKTGTRQKGLLRSGSVWLVAVLACKFTRHVYASATSRPWSQSRLSAAIGSEPALLTDFVCETGQSSSVWHGRTATTLSTRLCGNPPRPSSISTTPPSLGTLSSRRQRTRPGPSRSTLRSQVGAVV